MTIKRTSTGEGLPDGFPFSLAAEANGGFISGMPAPAVPRCEHRTGTVHLPSGRTAVRREDRDPRGRCPWQLTHPHPS